MFEVYLYNFGYSKGFYPTLAEAVKVARETGFECAIYNEKKELISAVKTM